MEQVHIYRGVGWSKCISIVVGWSKCISIGKGWSKCISGGEECCSFQRILPQYFLVLKNLKDDPENC